MFRGNPIENIFRDMRYALRTLCKSPATTIIAVLTFALGIGANTAIFSVIDAVILRPLPYKTPEQLVSLWEIQVGQPPTRMSASGASLGTRATAPEPQRMVVAPANLADYQNHVFSGTAGFATVGMNLTESGPPERLWGEQVTADFFSVLGIQPAQGRSFSPDEDRPGNEHVVIVSHELWQRRFGSDPHMLERTVTLDGQKYKIVGILPAGFRSPSQFGTSDKLNFYVPAAYPPELLANHADHEVNVVARLKPGVSVREAQAELDAISSRLEHMYPDSNTNIKALITPLGADIVRNVRTSLIVLLAAVGFILLIACANLANLLLVRALGRRREITIRYALGASRLRVIRELITQSTVLALIGCGAGMLLGAWAKDLLLSLAPPDIPRLGDVSLNARVLAFTSILALCTGVLFGAFPAWQASKVRPVESLKTSGRNLAGASLMRWRIVLMIAEVALSMVLLVGAGLLLKSFVLMNAVDLGSQPERVLAMNINLPEGRYGTAVKTLEEVMSQSAEQRRFQTVLLALLASLALVLSLVGVYGVVSYSAAQRTEEIGVRIALGACNSDIFRLVIRHAMLPVACGIACGCAGAYGLSRYLAPLLFQVKPTDPLTYMTLAFLLAGVALIGCYVPARRASRIDPMVALRCQ